jgi:hypothetical protein
MSSCRMLDVMATIGVSGATRRIQAVAETPSNMGMMMSMKMRSYLIGSWLTLFTASDPSRYHMSAGLLCDPKMGVTHSNLDGTVDVGQEFGSDPRARLVVLDQQYPRFPRTPQRTTGFLRRRCDL